MRSLVIALLICTAGHPQTLGELARKEAERRRELALQGIAGKVIETVEPHQGNLTISYTAPKRTPTAIPSAKTESGSARSYQSKLQSLDREIRHNEDQLKLLKARLAEERWAPPRAGRALKSQNSTATLEQLPRKISETEAKLIQLKDERLQVYMQGRKAGFLPGELEGRGITP